MAFRIIPPAEEDINLLYETGVRDFGVGPAEAYVVGLGKVLHFLSDFPRAARERLDISPPVRAHPYRSHIFAYEILDDDIVVTLRVRHGCENRISSPQ